MLTIQLIRTNRDSIVEGVKKRNGSADQLGILDELIKLDDQRKALQTQSDQLLSERNNYSREIGDLFKQGKTAEANSLKEKVNTIKSQLDGLQKESETVQEKLKDYLVTLPNVPHASVPAGSTEEDNIIEKDWTGPMPQLPADALPHWDLAEK